MVFFGKEYFLEEGTETISINTKIENLKNDHHYSYKNEVEEKETFYNILFYGSVYKVKSYQCILCLNKYKYLYELKTHFNHQHLYFTVENYDEEKNLLTIVKKQLEDNMFIKDFTFTRKASFIRKAYRKLQYKIKRM